MAELPAGIPPVTVEVSGRSAARFGTHFFHDLVEGDIFYVALFPKKKT